MQWLTWSVATQLCASVIVIGCLHVHAMLWDSFQHRLKPDLLVLLAWHLLTQNKVCVFSSCISTNDHQIYHSWCLMSGYRNYMQATKGDNQEERPMWAEKGGLDFEGRAKWDAWTAIKGTPGNKAMLSFVKVSLEPVLQSACCMSALGIWHLMPHLFPYEIRLLRLSCDGDNFTAIDMVSVRSYLHRCVLLACVQLRLWVCLLQSYFEFPAKALYTDTR